MGKKLFSSERLVTTQAGLLAWNLSLYQGMLDAGFVQTSDTGQITPETAASGAGFDMMIFRLQDQYETTHPVYFKLELSASWTTTDSAAYATIGRGSDGAGNLTGVIKPRFKVSPSNSATQASSAISYDHVASCGDGYLILQTCVNDTRTGNVSPYTQFGFILERSRNTDGSLSPDGIMFSHHSTAAGNGHASLTGSAGAMSVFAINYLTGVANLSTPPVSAPYEIGGTVLGPSTSLASGSIGPVMPWDIVAPGLAPWRSCVVVSIPAGDMPAGVFATALCGTRSNFFPIKPSASHSRWGIAIQPNASSTAFSAWFGAGIRWED